MYSNHLDAEPHNTTNADGEQASHPMTDSQPQIGGSICSIPPKPYSSNSPATSGLAICPNCQHSFELGLGVPGSDFNKSSVPLSKEGIRGEENLESAEFYFQLQRIYSFHCGRCDHVFESEITADACARAPQNRSTPLATSDQPAAPETAEDRKTTAPFQNLSPLDRSIAIGSSTAHPTKTHVDIERDYQAKHEEYKLGTVHPYEDIDVSTHLYVREYIIERLSDLRRQMLRSTTFKLLVGPSLGLILLVGLSATPQKPWTNATFRLVETLIPQKRNIPEPGIIIETTRIQRVATTDDARVYLLSGSVRNDGDSPLSDVLVEGLLYNYEGTRIFRGLNRISAVVGEAEAQELTPQVLTRLTQETDAPQFPVSKLASTLAVGESKPFSVIMIAEPNSEENTVLEQEEGSNKQEQLFYSTRIYSVG